MTLKRYIQVLRARANTLEYVTKVLPCSTKLKFRQEQKGENYFHIEWFCGTQYID